jgi:hypothetical protein
MRNGMLLALAVLLCGTGVVVAQNASTDSPAPPPRPAPAAPLPPPIVPPYRTPAQRPSPAPAAPVAPTVPASPPPSPPLSPAPEPPSRLVFDPTPAEAPGPPPETPLPPVCGPFCNKFWGDAQYLLWWTKDNNLPPIFTQGSPYDARPGTLGQPGTSTLFGGDVSTGAHSGILLRGGMWFDDDHIFGGDDNGFFLGSRTVSFSDVSGGNPVLAMPFLNVKTNREGAVALAYPGKRAAGIAADASTRVWGGDTNLRAALWRTDRMQICLLGGIRYLQLNESVDTSADVLAASSGAPLGVAAEYLPSSRFATENDFYGAQLGVDAAYWWRGFFFDAMCKLALGVTHETATIAGNTLVNTAYGGQFGFPFGGLALPTNIGSYSRNIFTVVPEVGLTLGYQITRNLVATAGYSFLFTSRAVRPGDIIDTGYNPTVGRNAVFGTPVVGPPRPTFPGMDSNFWAQGLNLGLELRF